MDKPGDEERESYADESPSESKDGDDDDDEIGRLATLLTKNDEFVKDRTSNIDYWTNFVCKYLVFTKRQATFKSLTICDQAPIPKRIPSLPTN